MSDTIKGSAELGLRFSFDDDDTRLVTLPNYRPNITSAQINEVGNYFKTNNLIIGDKTGASCTGISESFIRNKTVTKLDLN